MSREDSMRLRKQRTDEAARYYSALDMMANNLDATRRDHDWGAAQIFDAAFIACVSLGAAMQKSSDDVMDDLAEFLEQFEHEAMREAAEIIYESDEY